MEKPKEGKPSLGHTEEKGKQPPKGPSQRAAMLGCAGTLGQQQLGSVAGRSSSRLSVSREHWSFKANGQKPSTGPA